MKNAKIAECEYIRRWKDGSVDVVFRCYANGFEDVRNYKTMAAAKAQVKKFMDRCSRVYC